MWAMMVIRIKLWQKCGKSCRKRSSKDSTYSICITNGNQVPAASHQTPWHSQGWRSASNSGEAKAWRFATTGGWCISCKNSRADGHARYNGKRYLSINSEELFSHSIIETKVPLNYYYKWKTSTEEASAAYKMLANAKSLNCRLEGVKSLEKEIEEKVSQVSKEKSDLEDTNVGERGWWKEPIPVPVHGWGGQQNWWQYPGIMNCVLEKNKIIHQTGVSYYSIWTSWSWKCLHTIK